MEPRRGDDAAIMVNAAGIYTVTVTDATGAEKREPKCDGQSVAAVATITPADDVLRGRERDADGQCWEQLSVEPRRGDNGGDHGQCGRDRTP